MRRDIETINQLAQTNPQSAIAKIHEIGSGYLFSVAHIASARRLSPEDIEEIYDTALLEGYELVRRPRFEPLQNFFRLITCVVGRRAIDRIQ